MSMRRTPPIIRRRQSARAGTAALRDSESGTGLTFAMREHSGDGCSRARMAGTDRSSGCGRRFSSHADAPLLEQILFVRGRQLSLDQQYSLSDGCAITGRCRSRNGSEPPAREPGLEPPPLTLLSQYLPLQYAAIREGKIGLRARGWCCTPLNRCCSNTQPPVPKTRAHDELFAIGRNQPESRRRPMDGARNCAAAGELDSHAELLREHAVPISGFLAPCWRSAICDHSHGAGSSAFIGECLAPLLMQKLDAAWRPSHHGLAVGPHQYFQRMCHAFVSFGRSGSSPESVAVVELAERCCASVTNWCLPATNRNPLPTLPRAAQQPRHFAAARNSRSEFRHDLQLHAMMLRPPVFHA